MSKWISQEVGSFVRPKRIVDYDAKVNHIEHTLRKHGFGDPKGVSRVAETLVKFGVHDLSHLFAFNDDIPSIITGWKHIGDTRAEMVLDAATSYVQSAEFDKDYLSESIQYRWVWPKGEGQQQTAEDNQKRSNVEYPPFSGGPGSQDSESQGSQEEETSAGPDESEGGKRDPSTPLELFLDVIGKLSEGTPPEDALATLLVQESFARRDTEEDTAFWEVVRNRPDGVQGQVSELASLLGRFAEGASDGAADAIFKRPSHPVNIEMSVEAMADTLGASEEELRSLVRARQHYEGYPLPEWAFFDQTGQVEHFRVPMEGFLYESDRY